MIMCNFQKALFALLSCLFLVAGCGAQVEAVAGSDQWEPDIAAFEAADRISVPPKDGILFLGSSTIKRWDIEKYFPGLPVIRRGFGGSQIADSIFYADRILIPYRPDTIVFYAGENDINKGKSAEAVRDDFQTLVGKVHSALPATRIICIAIKPNPKRWHLVDEMRHANHMIRALTAKDEQVEFLDIEPLVLGEDGLPRSELFEDDELHFNQAGYKEVSDLLRPYLERHNVAGE